jgi:hypothetical protein
MAASTSGGGSYAIHSHLLSWRAPTTHLVIRELGPPLHRHNIPGAAREGDGEMPNGRFKPDLYPLDVGRG